MTHYHENSAPGDRLDIVIDQNNYIIRLLRRMEGNNMSRYTDTMEKIRAATTKVAALRELIKGLDGGTEAEYQEMVAAIKANADEVQAAIDENTASPPGSTGDV